MAGQIQTHVNWGLSMGNGGITSCARNPRTKVKIRHDLFSNAALRPVPVQFRIRGTKLNLGI